MFISFEGIEGCGKSTQANLLCERLLSDGYEVIITREPGGTTISERIREILLDPSCEEMTAETELLLFLAARHQHTQEFIKQKLLSDKLIICDRYLDSSIAYQGAARRLNLDFIRQLNEFATGGLLPDLTVVIDIPEDVAFERLQGKKKDRMEKENKEFYRRVRECFIALTGSNDRFILLDGDCEIKELSDLIYKRVMRKIIEINS